MAKAKLKSALDRYKGRDFLKEKQKKLRKSAEKKKRATVIFPVDDPERGQKSRSKGDITDHDDQEEEESDEVPELVDVSKLNGFGKESEKTRTKGKNEKEKKKIDGKEDNRKTDEESTEEEEEEHVVRETEEEEEQDEDYSDIDLEELSEEDLQVPDIIPHQRLTVNNTAALTKSHKSIALPIKSLPFSEHLSITTSSPVEIKDVDDDLNRELAFYKQALDAAKKGRELLVKEGIPFSRPLDYFAEMVKSDEHMGNVKQKLLDKAAVKKASQEARKLRDLKKFGKQVQVAKIQERDKAKKETLEKINLLKRKRRQSDQDLTEEPDMFDIALEEATKDDQKNPRREKYGGPQRGQSNLKRQKKNEKYGYGGKKRHAKSGDAVSSGDISGFSVRAQKARTFGGGGKGKKQRLGKSKRVAKG